MKYVFGMNGSMKKSLFFLDDHRVIYPAGHNVVVYNVEDKSQAYFHGKDNFLGISAISLSPLRKYLAIGQMGNPNKDTKPAILVYEVLKFIGA